MSNYRWCHRGLGKHLLLVGLVLADIRLAINVLDVNSRLLAHQLAAHKLPADRLHGTAALRAVLLLLPQRDNDFFNFQNLFQFLNGGLGALLALMGFNHLLLLILMRNKCSFSFGLFLKEADLWVIFQYPYGLFRFCAEKLPFEPFEIGTHAIQLLREHTVLLF